MTAGRPKRLRDAWHWRRSLAPVWGLLVGGVVLLIWWPGVIGVLIGRAHINHLKPLQTVDLRVGDALHKMFAAETGPENVPPICVVGVTTRDIETYGQMPWPRDRHAQLIERLDELGASVIAFDVFFPDPTPEDQSLVEACRSSNKVILPRWGIFAETADPYPGDMQASALQPDTGPSSRPVQARDSVFRRPLRRTVAELSDAARAQGHINVFYDRDLVARRAPAAVGPPGEKKYYLPLGVVAALVRRGLDPERSVILYDKIVCGPMRIPLDDAGCMLINYRALPDWVDARTADVREIESQVPWLQTHNERAALRFFTYRDVLDGRVAPDDIEGAVVLVGHCVWGSREDVHVTPYGSQFGVFVQAMLLHTALADGFLDVVSPWWILLAMLTLSVLLGSVCFRLRYHGSTYVIVAGGSIIVLLGIFMTLAVVGLLRRNGLVVDTTPFVLAIGLNLLAGMASSTAQVTEEAERTNRAIELLLAAGEKQMSDWFMGEPESESESAIPGASQIALSTSLAMRSPEIVAETFWQTVPCEGCMVFVPKHDNPDVFDRVIMRGFDRSGLHAQIRPLAERWAREAIAAERPAVCSRYDPDWPYRESVPRLRNMLAVPVIVHREPLAAVLLFNKRYTPQSPEKEFGNDILQLVGGLCYQAGALLENAHRYELEHDMFDGFARSMAKAIDVRDRYTHGHSERVAQLSGGIAHEMGLTESEQEIVRQAATLHDVGKIGVDNGILNKPGKLSEAEFAAIRSHAAKGYEILRGAPSFEPLLPGIRHHHERLDGAGYPDGLAGDAIPLIARIIAVADAYDAMTSDRIYRAALDGATARRELQAGAGTQFDPQVVKALMRHLDRRETAEEWFGASFVTAMRPH